MPASSTGTAAYYALTWRLWDFVHEFCCLQRAESPSRYYGRNNIHREVLPWLNSRSESSETRSESYCPGK